MSQPVKFYQTGTFTVGNRLLAPGGLVVVETSERIQPSLPSLRERTSRHYGAARLTLFENA